MKNTLRLLFAIVMIVTGTTRTVAQTFPEASTAASPKWYSIASFNRGGYMTDMGAGAALQHVDLAEGSYWWFEDTGDSDGSYYMHSFSGNTLSSKWKTSATESMKVWVRANGINTEGVCVSTESSFTGWNCADASNNGTGIGDYMPYSNDWAGTTWVFTEVDPFASIKAALADVIQQATDNSRPGIVGYYGDLTSEIGVAQAVVGNTGATKDEVIGATQTLRDAMTASIIKPTNGKYYYLCNADQRFQSIQHVDKALNANGTSPQWGTLDELDYNFIWQWTTNGEGYAVKNLGSEKYLTTVDGWGETEPSDPITIVWLAPGEWNIKTTTGGVMHANGHSSGAGVAGDIVAWGGSANSPSAWTFTEVIPEDLATKVIDKANAFITSADAGTNLGQTPQSAINDLQAAITTLQNGTKTLETVATLNEAIATASNASVWPVFTINSNIESYGIGKSIYEDTEGAQNHFTTTDALDYRQLWKLEGMPSTTITAGTTVSIKNAITGNYLNNGTANPTYTIRLTGESNDGPDGEYLIYPGTTSGNAAQVHAQSNESKIVSWSNTDSGSGSCWKFTYVGTSEEIKALESELRGYQTIMATATQKYETASAYAAQIGEGIGKYTEQTDGTIAAALAGYTGLDHTQISSLGTIPDISTALDNAVAGLVINAPATGTFLRFKNSADNCYATIPENHQPGSKMHTSTTASVDNIFYYDASNYLQAYATGYYLNIINHAALGVACTYSFEGSDKSAENIGSYKIIAKGTNNIWSSTGEDQDLTFGTPNCNWKLEEVTTLPVTLDANGYATVCAPVALAVSAGVKAYILTKKNEAFYLNEIEDGIIPAKTGAILIGLANATADLEITTSESAYSDNLLTGTLKLKKGPVTAYTPAIDQDDNQVLQKHEYTDADIVPCFSAYYTEADGEDSYRLTTSDVTTIIEAAKTVLNSNAIYNLNGQRVHKANNGVYIINGKKVIVK